MQYEAQKKNTTLPSSSLMLYHDIYHVHCIADLSTHIPDNKLVDALLHTNTQPVTSEASMRAKRSCDHTSLLTHHPYSAVKGSEHQTLK